MSNFLLFCKRTRVFVKYRFLTYKFRLLKFLGKFIPYFKPMSYTEKQALKLIGEHLINHIKTFQIEEIVFEVINKDENTLHNLFQNSTIVLNYFVKYPLPFLPHLEFLLRLEGDKYGIKPEHQILVTTNTATRKSTDNFFEFIDSIDVSTILTILNNVETEYGSIQINKK